MAFSGISYCLITPGHQILDRYHVHRQLHPLTSGRFPHYNIPRGLLRDFVNSANLARRLTLQILCRRMTIKDDATKILRERIGVREEWSQAKKDVNDLDLNEFKEAYARAKKRSLKPFSGDYYIGYYAKLPYVVPVAFQGTIALIFDLEGNVINNVYNQDPKYKIG